MERLSTEVAIVGGGIVGCSTALYLRQRGVPVVLLEKSATGAAASGVNFGGIRRNGRALNELPLAARALAVWRRMPALLGSDCEYAVTGHLKLARNDADMAELEAHARAQAAYDIEVEMISRNALRARYPWLGEAAIGAAWCASDGQANPRLVGPAFARAALAAGAEIREGTPVEHATRTSEGFEIGCAGGLVVTARKLVNAAGAWGGRIAAMFGETVPIEPITPQMIVTEPYPYFIEPALGIVGGDLYLRQIPRGNFIFGSGFGDATLDTPHAYVLPRETIKALAIAVKFVPRIAEASVVRVWSGFEGVTSDHSPVLCPSRTAPGLVHAFGFSGYGFALSPGTGEVVAELVSEGATSTPIEPFDIARFGAAPPA